MNVFLIGWNLPNERQAQAVAELRTMVDRYPILDARTVWRTGQGSQAFAASIHMAGELAAPRVYVARPNNSAIFFDGCPIERTGRFNALDSRDLGAFWPELPGSLTGQFFAARVCCDTPSVEIINDLLGVYQAYYIQQNSTWMISNSVYLLDRLSGGRGLDPLGASLFLCRGWVGGDRTLKDGIRVIPGAQRWSWSSGNAQPHRRAYFQRSSLARIKQRKVSPGTVRALADGMVANVRSLGDSFGQIRCPITAGRDTRVLVGLTLRSGVEAEYFTGNNPEAPDARIGSVVARGLGVSHELRLHPHADKDYGMESLVEKWEHLIKDIVRQSDGMMTIHFSESALPAFRGRKTAFPVHLFGMGGEIARGYYTDPDFYTSFHTKKSIKRHLLHAKLRNAYARPEAMDLMKGHVHRFVDEAISEGFRPIDIPTLFYAYERVRRWAATQFKHHMSRQVIYAPLCEGSFIEAAFSIPAISCYSENLHHELIKQLVPKLHALPYEQPWLSRSNVRNRATFWMRRIPIGRRRRRFITGNRTIRGQDRSAVLEAKRSYIRALCLDQKTSPLWDLIDREQFAQVMADKTSPADRRRHYKRIFCVATLFQYAALQD